MSEDLLTLAEASNHQYWRSLFISKRTDSPGYLSWQKIDNARIISWGEIASSADTINRYQDQFPSITIRVYNDDGYFNDETDANSIFYNAYNIIGSWVRIDAGYKSTTGVTYPSSEEFSSQVPVQSTIFRGHITNIQYNSNREAIITAEAQDPSFKNYLMSDISDLGPSASLSSYHIFDAILEIRDHTYGLWPRIRSVLWHVENRYLILKNGIYDTAGTENLTIKQFMQDSAFVANANFGTTRRGQLYWGADEVDDIIFERTGSVSDTNCIFHAQLDGNLTPLIPAGFGLTSTTLTPTYGSAYHNQGYLNEIDASGASFLIATPAEKVNLNRMTVQFWLQPQDYNISNGVNNCSNTVQLFAASQTVLSPYYDYMEVNLLGVDDAASLSSSLEVKLYQGMGNDGAGTTSTLYIPLTSTVNLTAGSNGFFGFVVDRDGIHGSADWMRMYYGHEDDSEASLAGVQAKGGGDVRYQIGNVSVAASFLFLSQSGATSYTGTSIIDDIKIYDYPKINFTDWKTSQEYFKKTKFYIQGPMSAASDKPVNTLGDISVSKTYDQVWNKIVLNCESSTTLTREESFTSGDSSSSDMYGVRMYEKDVLFIDTAEASAAADTIFNEYSEPKTQVDVKTIFWPFANLFDELVVNYQTPLYQAGSSVTETSTLYENNHESYSLGTDLVGTDYTVRYQTGTGTALIVTDGAGGQMLEVKDSSNVWVGMTNDDADLATVKDGVLSFNVKSYPGGRWGVTYNHSSSGGIYVQHLPGSQLRVFHFDAWSFLTGLSETANWDAYDPGTANSVELHLDGSTDEMRLVMDGSSIATYTATTYTNGTFGLVAFGAGGWNVDNILFQQSTVTTTTDYRQINIQDTKMKVVGMRHNLDAFESSWTLREID